MRFLERRPGRTAGEERVVIGTDDARPVGRGLWFAGRPSAGLRPWADLVVDDLSIVPEVCEALGPGGSIMVAYEGDLTQKCLRRKVPPCATPLGYVMLRAGCRWFKDWYYPEGGREGGTKLQATLPLDERRRIEAEEALVAELRSFAEREGCRPDDRERCEKALALLGAL